jgi:hypothetical protein
MVKSNYEILFNLKELDLLIEKKILSIHILDLMQVYKYFLDEMKENNNQKMVCYLSTSEHFRVSETTIMRIVKFMK